MKERRVKFKTAKLAREKGFDINTYSHCWVKLLDGTIIHYDEIENKVEHDRFEQYLMQPTQALLLKWLREEHNTHINITTQRYIDKLKIVCYYCEVETPYKNIELLVDKDTLTDFPLYEDALEAGLEVALKEIIK